jgi:hypothetical protein
VARHPAVHNQRPDVCEKDCNTDIPFCQGDFMLVLTDSMFAFDRKLCRQPAVKTGSLSCRMYFGCLPKGVASLICCTVQSAVGFAVTAKCSILRRTWLTMTITYKTLNLIVGTVKRSIDHRLWFRRKVFHDCSCFSLGGFLVSGRYFAIVFGAGASDTSRLTSSRLQ